jgi:uncharacterized protein YodC (DUF2158 family)
MENNIKPGDKVMLISGGPIMTVNSVKVDEITCEWFDKDKNYQSREFKLTSLKLYEPQPIIVGKRRTNYW